MEAYRREDRSRSSIRAPICPEPHHFFAVCRHKIFPGQLNAGQGLQCRPLVRGQHHQQWRDLKQLPTERIEVLGRAKVQGEGTDHHRIVLSGKTAPDHILEGMTKAGQPGFLLKKAVGKGVATCDVCHSTSLQYPCDFAASSSEVQHCSAVETRDVALYERFYFGEMRVFVLLPMFAVVAFGAVRFIQRADGFRHLSMMHPRLFEAVHQIPIAQVFINLGGVKGRDLVFSE